jgi:transposase InsO family protein
LVDEYSRWCYREIHAEKSEYASSVFICNALKIAPFTIRAVQTDNGTEFTNTLFGQKREEPTKFECTLKELGIEYRRIRVGTPKHNGRVEHQHGLDMQRFYKRLKFVSLDDARQKISAYNVWSNTRIKTCLSLKSPIQAIIEFGA